MFVHAGSSARKMSVASLEFGCNSRDDGLEQRDELTSDAFTGFEDFLVVERLVEDARRGICDTRNAENAHPAVARGNHFGNRGHADEIGSDGAQVPNLSRSFVAWTRQRGVDAFIGADAVAVSFPDGHFAESSVVRYGHVRKSR